MDSSGLAAFTRPGSYWQVSRAPRYSLLFALPLLVFYQVLAALQSQGGGDGPEAGLRNGADVILQSLFIAVAGTWGPVLFMACLIAVGLWLVVRDLHRHAGDEPQAHRRSEEHTSELQTPCNLVCRLLLEKKKRRRPSKRLE